MNPKSGSSPPPARADHLAAEQLVSRALGSKTGSDEPTVAAHLRSCASCRRLSRGADAFAQALRAGQLEEVPGPLREHAVRLFESQAGRSIERRVRASVGEAARKAVRALRFVLRPQWSAAALAAPAGVRSAQAVTRCELSASGYRLEMEWHASGRSWTVRGRLLSPPRAAAPGLLFESERGRPRRLAVGTRGFFGPVHGITGRVRARVETDGGCLLSPWIDVPALGEPRSRRRV
jgi:hypothetical protein